MKKHNVSALKSLSKNPLVSVIINNYNYAQYISNAIDSALNQSYKNVEIIVIDDCSTDNSKDIILSYGDKIKPIIFENRNKSKHPSFNQIYCTNKAFENSNGEIICLLDSDDYYKPDKVANIVKAFGKNPNAILVQDFFIEVDENCVPTGIIRPKLKKVDSIIEYYIENNDILNLFAQTSALSFKREYLEKMLPMKMDKWDEIWLDVRLTRPAPIFGDVITLNSPYTYYTNHGANDSLCLKDEKILYSKLTQMFEYVNSYLVKYFNKKIFPEKNINYCMLKLRVKPNANNFITTFIQILKIKKNIRHKLGLLFNTFIIILRKYTYESNRTNSMEIFRNNSK